MSSHTRRGYQMATGSKPAMAKGGPVQKSGKAPPSKAPWMGKKGKGKDC
jgi:hypothetical protein